MLVLPLPASPPPVSGWERAGGRGWHSWDSLDGGGGRRAGGPWRDQGVRRRAPAAPPPASEGWADKTQSGWGSRRLVRPRLGGRGCPGPLGRLGVSGWPPTDAFGGLEGGGQRLVSDPLSGERGQCKPPVTLGHHSNVGETSAGQEAAAARAQSPRGPSMEPPNSGAWAPRLLALALLLGVQPGAQAEVRVNVPPLVEVMRGDPVTLDCTPLGAPEHLVLEWYLVDRGTRHHLATAKLQDSEVQGQVHDSRGRRPPYQLDSRGRLVLATAQVGDEKDYVCMLQAGAAGTAEATASLRVFAKPEATEVQPNKGTLSVLDDSAQEVATCSSVNGNPAPEISWYRDGQLLKVPKEMNPDAYETTRTVKETSGLQSLTSTLYLRVHKADRDSRFHCSALYHLPAGRHGRLDSASFSPTLHYPTEHVQLRVVSPATTEGWVREGDSVQLSCRSDGSPGPDYIFFRMQNKQEDVLQTSLNGSLTLEGVQRNQSGTYGCKVEDFDAADDAQLMQTLELRVAYLDPLELSTEEELLTQLGTNVTINCSVQGLPTPTLRWTKDSVPLEDGSTLQLSSVTFESTGIYMCEASMPTVPLLSRSRSFKLLVQGLPELKPEILPHPEGGWKEGDQVRLTCFARGYPEPKLTWNQLGGSAAEPAPGGHGWVFSTLTLKVTSALSQDGVVCEASNPEGSASHVFHFGTVAPQSAQAGVAVLAVAVSVGLLLLVVAAFYCMRRKGRPRCCRRGEKGTRPPGEPELSHSGSGSQRPEQTGLLVGGTPGGAQRGSGGFGDEC